MTRTALLPILVLLCLAPLAAAGAGEGEDDAAWRRESRSLQVSGGDAGFTLTSARDSALGDDVVTGVFDADSAQLTLALRTHEPEDSSLRIDAAWDSLVEYRDLDGDGHYGLADETVQSLTIADLPHRVTMAPLLAGGHAVTATYTLPDNGSDPGPLGGGLPGQPGTLRLTFTALPNSATVAGVALDPTGLGTEVEVRSFPYMAGDSLLALRVDLATDGRGLAAGPASLVAGQGNHSWRAAWSDRARADGADAAAGWSGVASDATHAEAVLSLPRGETVAHAGSFSAHRAAASFLESLPALPPGDWRFYAGGVALVVLALGIPSLRRLREG